MLVLRPHAPSDVDHEMIWSLIGAAGLAALAALEFLRPHIWVPACPFKGLTGLPCMTCGGTRAALALGRLDFLGALAMNPLAALGLGAFGVYWLYAVWACVFRPPRRLRFGAAKPRVALAIRCSIIAAIVANWAYLIWARR